MFALDGRIRAISSLTVADVTLVVGVDALHSVLKVAILGLLLENGSVAVGGDDSHRDVVAIVHADEATGQVGPRLHI